MSRGVKIFKYEYHKTLRREIEIKIDSNYLKWRTVDAPNFKKVSIKGLCGIIFGSKSSTFLLYAERKAHKPNKIP